MNVGIRCWAHNAGTDIEAAYWWYTIIGNVMPLCVECCADWRACVEAGTCAAPVRIRERQPDERFEPAARPPLAG